MSANPDVARVLRATRLTRVSSQLETTDVDPQEGTDHHLPEPFLLNGIGQVAFISIAHRNQ